MNMEKLTVQEEEVMQRIWQLGSCTVKQILGELGTPPPPYTTVASVVNNLKRKDFVNQEQRGNTYVYSPAIPEEKYKQHCMSRFVRVYFSNSFKDMVSFFAKEEKLSSEDLQDIIDQIERGNE